ncbi:RNA-binding protein 4.1-like isoform X2 [Neocloeon triangulifer]|uniref:RNA-binding protein 4.1-like isoform X2 n=1 Tax=Neocloeon triangulifer TaxID=2078957 RepID=UPI00286F0BDF|nr:RNA-binding protein 4.1-like isoform X2 [Neocloeon triangulifer]
MSIDYDSAEIRTGANPPKTKIFVGRLPENATAPDLRRLFERYGVVTECDILNRYGFVHMQTEEMALEAISNLDNYNFMGSQISVEQSTGKKGGRGGRGGGGPMMRGGRGGRSFGGGYGGRGGPPSRGPPYTREVPREYDRRGPSGPPQPRNGYGGGYEEYDRGGSNGYDAYGYGRQQQSMMPSRDRQMTGGWGGREAERAPAMPAATYERRPPANGYSDMSRTYPERQAAPPAAIPSTYDRRPMYEARPAADAYARRTPPPPSAGGYGGYERAAADPYMTRRYDW